MVKISKDEFFKKFIWGLERLKSGKVDENTCVAHSDENSHSTYGCYNCPYQSTPKFCNNKLILKEYLEYKNFKMNFEQW